MMADVGTTKKNRWRPARRTRSFDGDRVKRASAWRQALLPVALLAVVLSLFFRGLSAVEETASAERLHSVERAVRRAVAQCYAIEGQYPASYSYLAEHYGLMVDEESYIVQIDFAGGNIMPQITVIPRYF